jgi:tight adherence protein B
MGPLQYIAAALVGVGLLLVFAGRALLSGAEAGEEGQEQSVEVAVSGALEPILDRLTAPFFGARGASRVATQLDLAGVDVRPQEWYALRAAMTALAFVFTLYLSNAAAVAVVLAAIVFVAPEVALRVLQRQRRQQIVRQLPEAMILMANALESGAALLQSMEVVVETIALPIRGEFARADREVKLGIPLEQALDRMAQRLKSRDIGMLVSAVQIHRQLGGSLAEILRSITETIRERVKLADRTRILTAQARASAYIITALPIAAMLLLLLIAPSYMTVMFTNVLGIVVLVTCAAMIAVAFILMSSITNVEI